jgi:hypothetical protein
MSIVKRSLCGVEFDLRVGEEAPSFIFGIRKSGSSIMNSMLNAVCGFSGREIIDVAGRLFQAGVRVNQWRHDPALSDIFLPGNIYGGFRDAPFALFEQPIFASARGILLVRDPRDALSSEYFSNAFTHSLPAEGAAREQMLKEREAALSASIEEFARTNAMRFRLTMREYLPLLSHPGFKIYKYEEAIMDKAWFLRDSADFLGLPVTDEQIGLILGWADVKPETERPTQFIRRVTPGDHKTKFSPALIADLNDIFADELVKFGYQA